MGGSSPNVFHTTPPQPDLKARTTLYSLSVGGAEASQNGLGERMPAKVVARSAMSPLLGVGQHAVDRLGGDLAVLHRLYGQIRSGDAVAPGKDARQRRLPLGIDNDAPALQRRCVLDRRHDEMLAHRF